MTALRIALPSIAVLQASGPQARDLLQAQLTQDLRKLEPGQALPAAYCTPQGRMLADFVLLAQADGSVLLLLHASLLEATLKRLRMFILRLQCRLEPLPLQPCGVLLDAAEARPGVPAQPWQVLDDDGVQLLRLPDAPGQQRLLLLAATDAQAERWLQRLPPLAVGGEADWELAAIRAGTPTLSAPTSAQFVPQMLNLELLGGIDFKKGCYPGQEVVARTAYRGSIKRRCYRVAGAAPMQPGDEIFDAADPGQPCGMVVNAAAAGDAAEALAELKIDAAQGDRLRLGRPDGPALQVLTLPYGLQQPD